MDDQQLTTVIAEQLAARTSWTWNPTGPAYTSGQVGVYYGALEADPDMGVGITVYHAADELETGLGTRRAQLHFRGARGVRGDADRLAGVAFDVLQGLARVAGLSLVSRVLVAQLGTDDSARQERADSYQIILDNPEATP
jgi:hypothetical protein